MYSDATCIDDATICACLFFLTIAVLISPIIVSIGAVFCAVMIAYATLCLILSDDKTDLTNASSLLVALGRLTNSLMFSTIL